MCEDAQNGFLVVVERSTENYSAYVPDLPGCVATGASYDQAVANIHRSYEALMESLPPGKTSTIKPTTSYAIISPHRFL